MTDLDDELQSAAARLGVPLASSEEAKAVRARAIQVAGISEWPLWDHRDLRTESLCVGEEAWRHLASLLAGRPNILFTEPREASAVLKLRDGEQLEALLGDTHLFEFYVFDMSPGGAMYCLNHHDVLIRFNGGGDS